MNVLKNVKIVFTDKKSWLVFGISSLILLNILAFINDYENLVTMINVRHVYLNFITEMLLVIFFGLNIAVLRYQIINSKFRKDLASATGIGSFLGILLTGCPLCGITFASFLGMGSFFAVLPFRGLEIKMLGLLLVIYSTISILRKGFVCKLPQPVKG